MKQLPITYECFKASHNILERLQQFKAPLTKLYETAICCYSLPSITDDENAEFFFLDSAEHTETVEKWAEEIKDLDEELEIAALKLAKLLHLKEIEYKNYIEQYSKQ